MLDPSAEDGMHPGRFRFAADVATLLVLLAPASCKGKKLALVDVDPAPRATASADASPTASADASPPASAASPPASAARSASAKANAPPPSATAAAKGFAPTCAGSCEYALRCASAYTASEQATCVAECRRKGEDQTKLAQINALSCPQLVAMLKGGGGTAPTPTNRGGGGCTASECNGCYWDQDMCLYTHGYIATGLKQACKPCCCPGH
jgi:hypothetical protein